MVAISNTPTPEQIHSILDRHATAAWPFAGSSLLRQHYQDVPLLSLVWGVGQVGLPFSESGAISVFGLKLPLQSDSTIVASLAPGLGLSGSLHLRVEEIAANDDEAARQTAALSALVAVARTFTAPLSESAANNGLKELLRTAEVQQRHNRVVVSASLSPAMLAALATPQESAPDSSAPPAASK
jgi:hypothetical protein